MIWAPSAPPGKQAYVAFRKTFSLDQVPSAATLHLFADSRYILWVNGRYVVRGPCRFDPKRPEYDTVDVRPWLQSGKNVLAVLVHHYAGGENGRTMNHVPCLTAQLDLAGLARSARMRVGDAIARRNISPRRPLGVRFPT